MANLQIKGIEDSLYEQLKHLAASENRSVSQQVLFLVKSYISKKKHLQKSKTPAQTLLELSGSWEDERTPEEIVTQIRKARKNSRRLSEGF
jgi:hypothetical protein